MKPEKIFDILDLARKVRSNGKNFHPLFVGPPGVGKSQVVQAWTKARDLPFIDLRAAYLESPDMIGFPSIVNGRTVHNTPEFWPQDPEWEGVILLEEINRGQTSVMNTFMQMLTDHRVHMYNLPKKAIIVACINPEGGDNEVNTMDPALKNRFQKFDVTYDKPSFVKYMKANNWSSDVVLFVESNTFTYKSPDEIGDAPGAKYVSPRNLDALNAVVETGYLNNQEDELLVYQTILGNNIGKDFYSFKYDESPVLFSHLVEDYKRAVKKLEKYSNPSNFKSGMISITTQDIVENGTIEDKLLAQLLQIFPVDQGAALVMALEFKRKLPAGSLLVKLCDSYPEIKKLFKDTLKHANTSK